MPGLVGTAAKTMIVLLACLAVADVAGVIACTIFDIVPLRASSTALPYAIWLVLGLFCGLSAYNGAGTWALHREDPSGEWTDQVDARPTGLVIVVTSGALLTALAFFFYRLYWSRGVAGEYFVPDSAPHTILFFIAAFAAIAGTHFLLVPRAASGNDPYGH